MKNKLSKEYLFELYQTSEDNMVYALTILKSLGLSEWFKNIEQYYHDWELNVLKNNIKFIDMFDLNKLSGFQIFHFVLTADNAISYFNQDQLDKMERHHISDLVQLKPKLKKYLINYEK